MDDFKLPICLVHWKRIRQWAQRSRVKPGSDRWIFKLQKSRVHLGYPQIFPKLMLEQV